jgi:hypothetical protein
LFFTRFTLSFGLPHRLAFAAGLGLTLRFRRLSDLIGLLERFRSGDLLGSHFRRLGNKTGAKIRWHVAAWLAFTHRLPFARLALPHRLSFTSRLSFTGRFSLARGLTFSSRLGFASGLPLTHGQSFTHWLTEL